MLLPTELQPKDQLSRLRNLSIEPILHYKYHNIGVNLEY